MQAKSDTDTGNISPDTPLEEAFSPEVFSTGFELALDKVYIWLQDFYALIPNIIVGLVIFGLFWILAFSVSRGIRHYFDRKDRTDLGGILSGFTFWGVIAFGVLLALTIIVPSLQTVDLLASLGIGSLAVGFAFKDILQNWLAGLLILLRMPFRRGDQIQVGEAEGTVQRVEPRATIIRTYDGRDIVVPNTTIYTNMVTVHTSRDVRRVEIEMTIGYVYEVRRVTAIIETALRQVEEILSEPPPQILFWDLGSTSLSIKIRWWISSERSEEVISRARAVQAIKEAFDANNIDLTDPQLVIYQAAGEGPFETEAPVHKKFFETSSDISSAPPPPEMSVDRADPEAEAPKQDPKEQTLLPEE